jgi:ketopantoate reductase
MSDNLRPHILIIGAGSMGIITGYHLTLSGAEVTFLIRPHRKEALDRPQILYCYDDNQLKEYTGYSYITDPAEMVDASYDYVVITLDGIALRNSVGVNLVKTTGDAARNTDTKIVLGTVGRSIGK